MGGAGKNEEGTEWDIGLAKKEREGRGAQLKGHCIFFSFFIS